MQIAQQRSAKQLARPPKSNQTSTSVTELCAWRTREGGCAIIGNKHQLEHLYQTVYYTNEERLSPDVPPSIGLSAQIGSQSS
jgi:hypothetical protein